MFGVESSPDRQQQRHTDAGTSLVSDMKNVNPEPVQASVSNLLVPASIGYSLLLLQLRHRFAHLTVCDYVTDSTFLPRRHRVETGGTTGTWSEHLPSGSVVVTDGALAGPQALTGLFDALSAGQYSNAAFGTANC